MSWIDLAKNDLIIITGDGREFRPLWTDPSKATDFNITQFEFPGVEGSYVSRGTSKGRKIPLKIYFSGDNHIDDADRFEVSSKDKRYWVVTHPYYGVINGHPAAIAYDDTAGNVTECNITFIETIVEDNPKITVEPKDKIVYDVVALGNTMEESFAVEVPKPDTKNINVMAKNVTTVYTEGKKKLTNTIDAEKYFSLFNDAQTAILNATDFPLKAIQTSLAIIHYPFQFVDTIKNRIKLILSQFELLRTSFKNLVGKRKTDKTIHEKEAGYLIATMSRASVTNMDYQSATEVLAVMETILETYNTYVADLDEVQTTNGGEPDSYIPSQESMVKLQEVVDYTVSNLISIALSAKQERSIILEQDSNIILLTHRFYGLQPDDSTLQYFMDTNNFSLNDILEIKKGRKIYYYV